MAGIMSAKRTIRYAGVVLFGILSVTSIVLGHHGVSDYDVGTVVSWQVTVTDFMFVNPHSLLNFTRKNEQGQLEEWQGELQSPSMLSRRGHWTKDTVKPGDQITVFGCRARNGSKTMLVRKVVLADGQEYPGG